MHGNFLLRKFKSQVKTKKIVKFRALLVFVIVFILFLLAKRLDKSELNVPDKETPSFRSKERFFFLNYLRRFFSKMTITIDLESIRRIVE